MCKVLVVGGGPAGMEATRIAALRGHAVTLCERTENLGGQVLLARQLPGRADIGRFLPWLEKQIADLGVEVRFDTPVTARQIVAEAPDAVILATGSRWDRSGYTGLAFQQIDGWENDNVLSITDALQPARAIGARVLVVDLNGFVQASGIAELLANQGKDVELVTPLPKLGSGDLDFTHQTPFIKGRLRAANVCISTETAVLAIAGKDVHLASTIDPTSRRIANADTVIVVGGRLPDLALADELHALGIPFHRIGDADAPFNIGKAFRDAWTVARGDLD